MDIKEYKVGGYVRFLKDYGGHKAGTIDKVTIIHSNYNISTTSH